ncbi:cell wall hydrolase [Sphingomonas koreensis]|nr:cell wall hydrolase [Sphingomonas koreensis]
MTFSQRAATIAAMFLFVAGTVGVSTPGFASELNAPFVSTTSLTLKALNASASVQVPTTPTPEIPGVTVQKLPDDSAASDDPDTDETAEYASLSAAVAAQDAPAAVDGNLACLAGAIYFESKGEPLAGQLAVANVIINRTQSGRFPTSICSVVTQPSQFSFVRHGHIPSIDTSRAAYRTALAVAQVALGKDWHNPAPAALFFHAARVSPGWGKTKVAAIGHHIFYR